MGDVEGSWTLKKAGERRTNDLLMKGKMSSNARGWRAASIHKTVTCFHGKGVDFKGLGGKSALRSTSVSDASNGVLSDSDRLFRSCNEDVGITKIEVPVLHNSSGRPVYLEVGQRKGKRMVGSCSSVENRFSGSNDSRNQRDIWSIGSTCGRCNQYSIDGTTKLE